MTDKIKVLHMTPPIVNNGIYKYIFTHMKYMNHDKFQMDFLMQNKEELMHTEEYKKYKFGIRTFTTTQRHDPQKFRQEIYDILSDGYDVLHLHTSFWRGFLIEEIAMEIGIPKVIVHSHTSGVDIEGTEKRNELLEIHESFKKEFNNQHATDFWACSQMAADWLFGEQISRDKIKILHHAIDTDRFSFNKEKRAALREHFNLNDKIVVGNVGRYCYQKNHEFLIKAFAKAREKNDKLVLVLVGEGNLQEELDGLIAELEIQDSVLRLSWQENVEDYLQIMDIFCFPSRFEGLGISLIEAQTAGLRCLVSDTVPGECKVTELVTFLPLEENIWVDAMLNSTNDYVREDMSEKLMEQGYDIKMEVKKLEELYSLQNNA